MKTIREYAEYAGMYIIRTDAHVSTLAHFAQLFEEARKDFPDLKPENVKIVQYAGRTYKYTFGIEFKHAGKTILKNYFRIWDLEETF